MLRRFTIDSLKTKKSIASETIAKGIQTYHRGDINDAIELLLESIKHSPDDPHPYFELAEILLRTHNYKDAMDVMNEMPRGREDIRKSELMGYCSLGMDLDQGAIKHAKQALSLNGSSPKALNLMGVLSFRQGKINAAEYYFKKAIKANPGYGEPHTNLGKMHLHRQPWKMH